MTRTFANGCKRSGLKIYNFKSSILDSNFKIQNCPKESWKSWILNPVRLQAFAKALHPKFQVPVHKSSIQDWRFRVGIAPKRIICCKLQWLVNNVFCFGCHIYIWHMSNTYLYINSIWCMYVCSLWYLGSFVFFMFYSVCIQGWTASPFSYTQTQAVQFCTFFHSPTGYFFAKVLQLDMGDWGDTISLQKFLNWQPKFRFSSSWKGHEKKSYLDMELLPRNGAIHLFTRQKRFADLSKNQSVRLKSFYECWGEGFEKYFDYFPLKTI